MPAYGVVGVDFHVWGAVLADDEDGDADCEGIVEELGGRGGGGAGLGGVDLAVGEDFDGLDGGAGGWAELGGWFGGGGWHGWT